MAFNFEFEIETKESSSDNIESFVFSNKVSKNSVAPYKTKNKEKLQIIGAAEQSLFTGSIHYQKRWLLF